MYRMSTTNDLVIRTGCGIRDTVGRKWGNGKGLREGWELKNISILAPRIKNRTRPNRLGYGASKGATPIHQTCFLSANPGASGSANTLADLRINVHCSLLSEHDDDGIALRRMLWPGPFLFASDYEVVCVSVVVARKAQHREDGLLERT